MDDKTYRHRPMNMPGRRLIMAVPAVLILAVPGVWLAISRHARTGKLLRLPAQVRELVGMAAESRDAMDLSHELRGRGYTGIIAEGMDGPAPVGWTPRASETYIQFWKLFTGPGESGSSGAVIYRLCAKPARRTITLTEPPGLVELAREGKALERDGRTGAALAAFRSAQSMAPGLPALSFGAARCYLALREPSKAVQELRRAIGQAGADPVLYEAMGETCESLKDRRQAALAFEQAAGLDGSSARRWIRAARALHAAGNAPAAAAAVSRALALEPGNPEASELRTRLKP